MLLWFFTTKRNERIAAKTEHTKHNSVAFQLCNEKVDQVFFDKKSMPKKAQTILNNYKFCVK